ncbi:MAG: SurA N-terminal domain-containing protein [Bacteroidaceae bacterium]|nr:SurA N-terminal domain-containing protein [Bacteroidaceae bacterium]
MATLQNLRNKGPLLVIFVGIALFAFIAGDAVKLFDSHSVDTSVGSVGEKELDAMEYQQIYNEFDCFCRVSGFDVPEENRKAVIWELASNSALYNQYAEELGITITAEEMNYVLANGKSMFIRQTVSPQNPLNSSANFNMDFLAQLTQAYEEQKAAGMIDQNVATFYNCWKYMEREVTLEILRNKINALVANSTIANPAVAQKNFDLNNNVYTLNVALYPYNRMNGDSIAVSDEEIANYYKENKEFSPIFKNAEETRDIKYVVTRVVPSSIDLENLKNDMISYADTLKAGYNNYQKLVRFSRSMVPHTNILLTKELIDASAAKYVDTLEVNEVYGPVDNTINNGNKQINTYDVYMNIEKALVPDTLLVRAITIDASVGDLEAKADSLANLLNGGADFKAVASNYQATFDSLTICTSNANDVIGLFDDIDSQKDIYNAPVGQYLVTDLSVQSFNGKMIFQVIEKKGEVAAYNTLVLRREKVFSNETYNQEYDKFCKFVGSCKNLAELEEKAKQEGTYFVLPEKQVTTGAASIARVPKTGEFIDWIYNEATKLGQISDIRKCGEDDCFMAIALENINEKGDRALESEIYNGLTLKDYIKSELQGEKVIAQAIAEMDGKKVNDLKNNSKVSTYNVDKVEFKKPTNISPTMQDETVIGAVAAKMNAGETSAPFKGTNGVYVIEVTAKNAKNGTFNATAEKNSIESQLNPNYSMGALENTLNKLYPKVNRAYIHF